MSKDCWIEKISKEKYKGKKYIVNVEKGESYWGLMPSPMTPLPIGWVAHSSKSRGRLYYSNPEQKKIQWELPTETYTTLPDNWAIKKSRKCDQTYYYDITNKKTQWEFPNTERPTIPKSSQPRVPLNRWEFSKPKIPTVLKSSQPRVPDLTRWEFSNPEGHTIPKSTQPDERELLSQQAANLGQQKVLDAEKRKKAPDLITLITLGKEARHKVLTEQETGKEAQRIFELQEKQEEQRKKSLLEAANERDAYTSGSILNLNPDKVEIKWLSTDGNCELTSRGKPSITKTGTYSFNKATLEIITELEKVKKIAKVMIAKCDVSYESVEEFLMFIETTKQIPLAKDIQLPKGVEPLLSNVQDIIQGTKSGHFDSQSGRHKMIVLPSQLNGAEYKSQNSYDVVDKLELYLNDNTGGPRGQLAADPGVAQFIIDNACNETRESRDAGINNVKAMGIRSYLTGDKKEDLDPLYLRNGYLQVKDDVNVEGFINVLPQMTILGVRDVPVRGLDITFKFIKDEGKTVDLIYASAVPLTAGYGNSKTDKVITIANVTLFSQYVGAMRLAVSRGNCDLYLMPLGGGVFENKFHHIKAAIAMAYKLMESELKKKGINVKVIVWEGDGRGGGADERKAFGFDR